MMTMCSDCAPLARASGLEETCKGVIVGTCTVCGCKVGVGDGRKSGIVFKGPLDVNVREHGIGISS